MFHWDTATKSNGKYRIALIAILISTGGSFHFGYQLSSVNPTETIFRQFINQSYFDHYGSYLDDSHYRLTWSVIISLSVLGDFIGAPFLIITERLGRKNGLYLASGIMFLSFFLEGISKWVNSFELFAFGRFLMGLGDGWTVSIQTIYLSECSPKQWRGLCGGIIGSFVELGLIAGSVVTLPNILGTSERWPFVYILESLLILIMWSTLPFLKESPKYLAAKGRLVEAKESLRFFRHPKMDESLREIMSEISSEKSRTTVAELFQKPHLRRALFLGALVWLVSSFSGMEAISFFSTRLFADLGLGEYAAKYSTIGVSCQAFLATLVSSLIIDRLGRRPLLLSSTLALAILNILFMVFTLLYVKYRDNWYSYACVTVQCIWVFFFGVGPAVLQWTVICEMMPQNARSTAVALINAINLLVVMGTRLAFLPLHGLVGAYSFLLFIVPLCIFTIITLLFFPETKNRSTTDILKAFGHRREECENEFIGEALLKNSKVKGFGTADCN